MHHPFKIIFVLVITLSLLCCLGRQATAFTLRFASFNEVEARISDTEASDLPTPQLFRTAIRQDDVILGAIHPSEGFGIREHAIGLPETAEPQPVQTSKRQAVNRQSRPYRLSGVELLLLRDTPVMAAQPGEAHNR